MAPPGRHGARACCTAIVAAVRDVARRVAVTCMWLQRRSHRVTGPVAYGCSLCLWLQASQVTVAARRRRAAAGVTWRQWWWRRRRRRNPVLPIFPIFPFFPFLPSLPFFPSSPFAFCAVRTGGEATVAARLSVRLGCHRALGRLHGLIQGLQPARGRDRDGRVVDCDFVLIGSAVEARRQAWPVEIGSRRSKDFAVSPSGTKRRRASPARLSGVSGACSEAGARAGRAPHSPPPHTSHTPRTPGRAVHNPEPWPCPVRTLCTRRRAFVGRAPLALTLAQP